MAIWNEDYYKGEDSYSDGIVEDEILKYIQNPEENLQTFIKGNYAKAYHLLPIRENIINWYPFKKEETALEIGAGCGAITGALCVKLGKIVSVDLSKKRSQINFERHKDFENLTVMVGNLNDMEFEGLFDYVVLNGVLEYAISFTDGKKPYHIFLKRISQFLKPNGKILIAIENKLGLKYFNGSKEDHTGNYFLGLNGYINNHTVRTFTKQELKNILNEVGFSYTKFYYPYPDYKFPNEIYTDESLKDYQYGKEYLNYEEGRYNLFDEHEVGNCLINEEIRDVFANSFLIEASKEEVNSNIVYAKLNSDRKEELRIGTVILKEGKVLKFPLSVRASEHINTMEKYINNWEGKRVRYLKGERINNSIYYKYLQEKNLDSQISELINEERIEKIISTLKDFYECYENEFKEMKKTNEFYSEEFVKLFGDKKLKTPQLCVKNVNIDIILDNIFKMEDGYLMIDGEWVFNEWIPYSFIVWRSINELFCKHIQLEKMISRKHIYDLFGIEQDDIEIYYDWAIHFVEEYVGSKQLHQIEKVVTPFSLDQEYQRKMRESRVTMSLYIDRGEGFAEETKLYQTIQLVDNHFEIRFSLDNLSQIKQIRFDPVENMVCSCNIAEMSDWCENISNNSDEKNGEMDYFYNGDPQYLLQLKNERIKNIDESYEIYFKGVLNIIRTERLNNIVFKLDEVRKKLELNNSNFEKQIEQINLEKQEIKDKLRICEGEKEFYRLENEKNEYLVNNTRAYVKKKIIGKWKK